MIWLLASAQCITDAFLSLRFYFNELLTLFFFNQFLSTLTNSSSALLISHLNNHFTLSYNFKMRIILFSSLNTFEGEQKWILAAARHDGKERQAFKWSTCASIKQLHLHIRPRKSTHTHIHTPQQTHTQIYKAVILPQVSIFSHWTLGDLYFLC